MSEIQELAERIRQATEQAKALQDHIMREQERLAKR